MRDEIAARVWEGQGAGARVARALLGPVSGAFALGVRVRNAAYDRGWFVSSPLALPTVSVGNLTVGGTGKTPLASWLAGELIACGIPTAIVLRGYGRDETLVHERLCPRAIVVASPNRVEAVRAARLRGARVAVLDDGFQHRQVRRDADVVVIAAEQVGHMRLLPAGPWREPLASLARASLVAITRKSAAASVAREVAATVASVSAATPVAIVHLEPEALVNVATGARQSLDTLSGRDVVAVAAVGNPTAFAAQLRAAGANVSPVFRRDHHEFNAGDVQAIRAQVRDGALAVCTLKDAVKLERYWPRDDTSLWYLSQRISIEEGALEFRSLVARLAELSATIDHFTPASTGPTVDSHVP